MAFHDKATSSPRAILPHQAAPFADRPNEGQFALGVEFSPMASPEFEPGRSCDAAVELSRFLERGLKQSGACARYWCACDLQLD